MDAELSYRPLANFRGVCDPGLRDLDYLLRDQFRERIVAILDAKGGQRSLISSRQAPDLVRTHGEFLEQRVNRHGALPDYAGGSAIGLSATDAYGTSLLAGDAGTIPRYWLGLPGKGNPSRKRDQDKKARPAGWRAGQPSTEHAGQLG